MADRKRQADIAIETESKKPKRSSGRASGTNPPSAVERATRKSKSPGGFARLVGRAMTTVVEHTDIESIVSAVDIDEVLDHVDLNALADRLDLDRIIERLDVNVIADRLDLDRVIERLDVNVIADRLDLDRVIDRMDVNRVAERLDLDQVVARLDVNQVADRLDLDSIVNRMDVNAVAERIDMDQIVDRLDVNAIAQRLDMSVVVEQLDVNAVAERIDLEELISRVDLAPLIGRGTQEVAETSWNFARRQIVRADFSVDAVVSKVLRRSTVEDVASIVEDDGDHSDAGFHHHPAGAFTRALAFMFDAWLAIGLFGLIGAVTNYLWRSAFGSVLDVPGMTWVDSAILAIWLLAYGTLPVAWFGRSPGHFLLGIKVLPTRSGHVGFGRALVRVIVLFFTIPVAVINAVLIAVRPDRRLVQDMVSSLIVVYDWGGRPVVRPEPILKNLRRTRFVHPIDG